MLAVRPVMSPATFRLIESALGELVDDVGLSSRQAIFTLDTIVAFVTGHVLAELSANPVLGGHAPEVVAAIRTELPVDEFPQISRTLAEGAVDRTAEFEHGVTLIIEGVRSLVGD